MAVATVATLFTTERQHDPDILLRSPPPADPRQRWISARQAMHEARRTRCMGSSHWSRYNPDSNPAHEIEVPMRLVIGIVLVLLASLTAIAAEFSTLEERMSKGEFHSAGLDKLSPDELKALNDWLRTHNTTTTVTQFVTPTGQPVYYPEDSKREVIESRIDGGFSGWYGKNVFKLENGQEWTQAESGQFTNGRYDHPKVKIKPALMGSWLMYVEPCGCSVRVTRTK
jgi:hypothetical protein